MAIGSQGLVPRRKFQPASSYQTDIVHQQTLEILIEFSRVRQDLTAFDFTRGMSAPISAQKTDTGPAIAQEWYIDESLVCSATHAPWRNTGIQFDLRSHYLATRFRGSHLICSHLGRFETFGILHRLMNEYCESSQHVVFNLDMVALVESSDLLEMHVQHISLPEQQSLPIYLAEPQAILAMSQAQEKQENEMADEINSSHVKPRIVHDGSDE